MKKTKKTNRITSALLAFILIFCTLSTNISALDILEEDTGQITYPVLYDSVESGTEVLDKSIDTVELRHYLIEQLATFANRIDISKFEISNTTENIQAIKNFIWHDIPEAFQVNGLGTSIKNNSVSAIIVTYNDWCSADEYPRMYSELQGVASELLDGIENNEFLTDVEKALLIHDRLAVWNEYDYSKDLSGNTPRESYTAYGALVKRTSVCDGYTKAYMYLLNCVGIKNIYCSSEKLNHAWNIVYINNIPYHVDVTWDDYAWGKGERGAIGVVVHENFLRSSDGIYSTSHVAYDYDTSPKDTTYDNYFWQKSETAFQLINNELYYIDNESANLKRYSDNKELCSVSSEWRDAYGYWGNNARLSSDAQHLYYSLSKAVYKYDVSTQTSTKIFEPNLSTYNCIYGFEYSGGYLICDINDAPPYSGYISDLYQIKELYDTQSPVASITSTNNISTGQTVTINMSDNAGIAGYYWGTNSTYSSNTYTATSSTSITKTIANAGTYYLVVKDISGNLSDPESITFYKTTLNGNGGSVSPTAILTAKGNTFTFPAPVRNGYNYKGWSTSSSSTSGITSVTPSSNMTYYAVWEEVPVVLTSVTVFSKPNKTSYYIGDSLNIAGLQLKLIYDDGSVKYTSAYDSISGYNSTTPGTKTITVAYNGKTTSFDVTVKTPSITLSETGKTLTIGDTATLTAISDPSGQSITWISSNPDVATVSGGTITAKSAGTAVITAKFTYNNKIYSNSCKVTIKPDTVCVSGNIISFGENTAVTIRLLQGNSEIDRLITTSGAYQFDVVPGTYNLEVSKTNHVTRIYTIAVGNEDIIQDVKIHLLGDVTGDGKVNTIDVNRVYAHVRETNTLTGYELECANVTGTGATVNTIDVNRIYAHVKETNLLW